MPPLMCAPSAEGFWSTLTPGILLAAEAYSLHGYVEVLGLVGEDVDPEGHLRNAGRVVLTTLSLSVLAVRFGLPVHIALDHQAVDMPSRESLPMKVFRPYRVAAGWGSLQGVSIIVIGKQKGASQYSGDGRSTKLSLMLHMMPRDFRGIRAISRRQLSSNWHIFESCSQL